LQELRRELVGRGAAHETGEEKAWSRAVAAAEEDVATLLDISLRAVVAGALKSAPSRRLAEILAAIAPELDRLDALGKRFTALSPSPSTLKEKVTGRRLAALVEAAFGGFDARDRHALVKEVEALVGLLKKAGLGNAIPPQAFLHWTAEALLRGDTQGASARTTVHNYDGYRRLRAAEQRVSSSFTLAEVSLVVAPAIVRGAASFAEVQAAIAGLNARLPEETSARVVEGDLARIMRALHYLETFWAELTQESQDEEQRLLEIVNSKFFDILWDESALTRFALEARNVVEVFPGHHEAVGEVRRRIEELDSRTRSVVTELFRRRSDAAWAKTLPTKKS